MSPPAENLPLLSVAPMMDVTDRHCRYFLRQIAPGLQLYTEMVSAAAVLHGDRQHLLGFDPAEHPVAVQLAGNDPAALAEASRIAAGFGYDEINLNIGCPSARVSSGRLGACLMAEPDLVARCVAAMRAAVTVPVTVKTRIGIDDHDDFAFLAGFVTRVAAAGCETFIVHARKALLQGLSPRANRSVPPLRHEVVYRLKQEFPQLRIVVNGGFDSLDGIAAALERVDGVMLGRKAADDPWFLAGVQARFHGSGSLPDRSAVVRAMHAYLGREQARGVRPHHVTRHMLGLYRGVPGARGWRRFLAERAGGDDATADVLLHSLAAVAAA